MKGHGWLPGQPISERWHVRAAKTLFSIRLGKMLQNEPASDQDVLVPYLKAVHVQWQGVRIDDLPEMWAGRAEIEQYGAHDGDLLVCEGGEVGRAASLTAGPRPCIIQNALHRVRSREHADSRFFKYVLEHLAHAGWFDVLCNKATIAHLTSEKLGAIRLPAPPQAEQRRIAAFLDGKIAAIDQSPRRSPRIAVRAARRTSCMASATGPTCRPRILTVTPPPDGSSLVPARTSPCSCRRPWRRSPS